MNTRMLCLGVLTMGNASGYDIGKKLEQVFGNFIDVAASGVYPALRALYEEGLVDYQAVEQDALPNKKVYTITEQGHEAFRAALGELPPRHRIRSQFVLLLFYAELLSGDRLAAVLEERKTELRHWLRLTENWQVCPEEGTPVSAGRDFIARLGKTMLNTELSFLEAHGDQLVTDVVAEQQGHSRS